MGPWRPRRRSSIASVLAAIVLTCTVAPLADAAVQPHSGYLMCARTTMTPSQTVHAVRIVRDRLRFGYHMRSVSVTRSGGCVAINGHNAVIKRRTLVAVSPPGNLAIVAVRHSAPVGTSVRRAVGRRILVASAQILRESVRIEPPHQGQTILAFRTSPAATTSVCRYTRIHVGNSLVVALDGRIFAVLTIEAPVCAAGMAISIPATHQTRTPGGLAAVSIDVRYGPLPAPLAVRSSHS